MDIITLMELIPDPPQAYRGVPFWSWNDRLDAAVLRRQIQEMKKAGLGGFFMHARGGLQTEYLSDEWLDCIEAGIAEAGRQGMAAWCYDENGWPSGFAGGLVTGLGEAYHLRWLELEETDPAGSLPQDCLGNYRWDPASGAVAMLQPGEVPRLGPAERILTVREKINPYYSDILNPEVVKAFLDCTHETYFRHFQNEFGRTMPGFFTDEPQFKQGCIPWSTVLETEFYKRYRYDVKQILPALFREVPDYASARYHFWSLISELYVTSYGKQVYEWCEKHHCQLTGHVMQEDSLFSQMGATAGSMPFYEYMHIPGIDWLGRRIGADPVTPKQAGSAAAQLGKRFVISEMFALCGWNVSFEELKWIAEWQYVNGINLICQHLEGYSLRGLRKRDYPPSLFIQQPWWGEYKAFNDYFARLGMLLAEGKSAVKLLLIHPMHSAWIAYDGTDNAALRKLDEDLAWASRTLAGLHVDYHYGDETLLARHGKISESGLAVGACVYQAVVLPSLLSLDEQTVDLLEQWLDRGGPVISVGGLPRLCGGRVDARLQRLSERVIHAERDRGRLYQFLADRKLIAISISDHQGEISAISYRQMDLGTAQLFFLVNHDQHQTYDATVTIHGRGAMRRLALESGQPEPVAYEDTAAGVAMRLQFLPMQSHLLILEEGTQARAKQGRPDPWATVVTPGAQWHVTAMDWNALTLDECSYRIDEGPWQGPLPVIKLMDLLLNLQRGCRVQLKFVFDMALDPARLETLFLVLETPWLFEMAVNGRPLEYKDAGWWKDSAFKKVDLRGLVQTGRNEILLQTNFYQNPRVYEVLFGKDVYETERNKLTYDVELESLYLVGDFGVASQTPYQATARNGLHTDGPFIIVAPPRQVTTGDLTTQGFCFFAGSVTLSQTILLDPEPGRRIVLQLDRPDAVVAKVFINGRPVRTLLWAPYTVDITDFAVSGPNQLAVQLFSGNRNLLGPHHHIDGELYNVGPGSFTGQWSWTEKKFGTVPETAEEHKKNFWRDGYSLVRFGLRNG
ncbi:alpha-L-rhamnosidase-like protein [Hydrogenispora ethanolica]|uniref:Alpha-L-rhamnosidase-like protein n=1 Tax=Hydrogenispora ethanolica TaxID=1082276 RepID=A0A4R1R8U7_HYDET|nr:glycosyl hydrolase [Hydrogenispora ethanolica]TCL61989.1 alpha-L-rhamnosidase-like protein [Hydrogenispora ethanolica]